MEFEPVLARTGYISVKTWLQRNGAERAVLYPSTLKTEVFFLFRPFFKGLDIPLHCIKSIVEKRRWGEYDIRIAYEKMGKEKHVTLIFSPMLGGVEKGKAFCEKLKHAMPRRGHA